MRPNQNSPTTAQANAMAMAVDILSFLAEREDDFIRFISLSGLGPDELRSGLNDPEILAGIMDFLLSEDRLVLDFTQSAGLAPTAPAQARAHLPGYFPA
jgi:hypothetical protein